MSIDADNKSLEIIIKDNTSGMWESHDIWIDEENTVKFKALLNIKEEENLLNPLDEVKQQRDELLNILIELINEITSMDWSTDAKRIKINSGNANIVGTTLESYSIVPTKTYRAKRDDLLVAKNLIKKMDKVLGLNQQSS